MDHRHASVGSYRPSRLNRFLGCPSHGISSAEPTAAAPAPIAAVQPGDRPASFNPHAKVCPVSVWAGRSQSRARPVALHLRVVSSACATWRAHGKEAESGAHRPTTCSCDDEGGRNATSSKTASAPALPTQACWTLESGGSDPALSPRHPISATAPRPTMDQNYLILVFFFVLVAACAAIFGTVWFNLRRMIREPPPPNNRTSEYLPEYTVDVDPPPYEHHESQDGHVELRDMPPVDAEATPDEQDIVDAEAPLTPPSEAKPSLDSPGDDAQPTSSTVQHHTDDRRTTDRPEIRPLLAEVARQVLVGAASG
ncbi:uncharacterized protein BJ171DRAFT_199341 [Polychytrium aggregatum]|uniref:uncharacterized protein n=1 Tax=Polychytrium aggregatum TaxID=110093 RepID=UPI0022FEC6C8|nr:uncharacterized protein BJ171DRAFT_199341 [Polychytrium aggregatum]KAI9199867.1 hypothetical protein BJ171DRAFT_199341 [Polychytrium aggregatum]